MATFVQNKTPKYLHFISHHHVCIIMYYVLNHLKLDSAPSGSEAACDFSVILKDVLVTYKLFLFIKKNKNQDLMLIKPEPLNQFSHIMSANFYLRTFRF